MPEDETTKTNELDEHPLVTRVVGDPEQPTAGAVVLTGFLGRSPEGDKWRLYGTTAFDNYVEIPADSILATDTLPENSGNRVWIKTGTQLTQTKIASRAVSAEFLSGSISSSAGAAASRTFVPRVVSGPRNLGFRIPVTQADNCTWAQTHCPGCWPNHGTEVGFGCDDSDFPCTDSWACE